MKKVGIKVWKGDLVLPSYFFIVFLEGIVVVSGFKWGFCG